MGALADLLGPYRAAEQARPTTPQSLGLGGGGSDYGLMDLVGQQGQPQLPPGAYQAAAGDTSHWEDVARRMAANQYGWGPGQFGALDQIATAESGWNPGAVNQSSGAAGIPQALPSAHPGLVTNAWMHDPRSQISWMLNYIGQRYGTPQNALAVRQQQGWY